MTAALLVGMLLHVGCGSKDGDGDGDDGGNAVGGTMQIAVPSPFQMAIVNFKLPDGSQLGRVESVDETNYDYTRQDGSVVRLILEKKQLVANDPAGQPLYSITREGEWIKLTVEGETEPVARLKYVESDVEVYQAGESPVATLKWISDGQNWVNDEIHLTDSAETVLAVAAINDGATVLRDPAGETKYEAIGMADRLPLACLAIEGLSLDQQIGLAVFVAAQ